FENNDGIVDVQMIDVMGKSVKWERFSVNRGYNSLRSTIEDLASGIYYLKIQRTDMSGDAKMIRFTKK
ncbi:MAG: T9SS type A sorting domain-containing protein, partial [Bacteroidota bacterium]